MLTRRSDGPNDTAKAKGIRTPPPRLRRHLTCCRSACNTGTTTCRSRDNTNCLDATTITKGSFTSAPISLEPGMSQFKQFEVAVIGGGIAGLTLAIALHHRAIPVTIYEQAPAFGEIGAGVSFSPNAVQAMDVCCSGITEAYNQVCTKNMWPSKQKVWFDYLDGHADSTDKAAFTISNELGQNGVHRARFLDNLVKLLPSGVARFGKRLSTVTTLADGKQEMRFEDGSRAQADAVIGCDGIKSQVRQIMFGARSPFAKPSYTFKYAYRGLVAMHDAVGAIGEERAQNACMHVSNRVTVS
jgi:salicylate hydroxylase